MADLDDFSHGQLAALFTGGCLALIIMVVLGTVLNGWALMLLWGWFMVIPFGLPALSIGQAIGLSTIVTFVTYQHIDCPPKEESVNAKTVGLVGLAIFRPLFTVAFGRLIFYLTYGH